MKRLLTVSAVIFVAAVWMTGSWFFFNSIAVGDQEPGAPAVADAGHAGSKNENAAGDASSHAKGNHSGLFKKLNLTDAQKDEIKAITTEERSKIKPLTQQLKAGRKQLNALRKSGPFDEAKVRSIARGQADAMTELIVVQERMHSRVYAVLTPEQRTKAEELQQSSKGRPEKGSEPVN